jgi:hypothetical protein
MNIKRHLVALFVVAALLLLIALPAIAATTADVTVTATPAFISITDNATSYDFGVVAASSTTNTSVDYINIDNTSTTVQTDVTIAVTGDWTGGGGWTHSNTATIGADTAGMYANDTTWGVGEVIVETLAGSPNDIYTNLPASTNFSYGISLLAPSSFTDGVQKTNTIRITSAAG